MGSKTDAWMDSTRNASGDLYDLWAMADAGMITPAAARLYKRHGLTGRYPRATGFPEPPNEDQWMASLSHQCVLRVGPAEAFETVVKHWQSAVEGAEE